MIGRVRLRSGWYLTAVGALVCCIDVALAGGRAAMPSHYIYSQHSRSLRSYGHPALQPTPRRMPDHFYRPRGTSSSVPIALGNGGAGTGLGSYGGLRTPLASNAGLGTPRNSNAGLRTPLASNAGLRTPLTSNAGLGTGLNRADEPQRFTPRRSYGYGGLRGRFGGFGGYYGYSEIHYVPIVVEGPQAHAVVEMPDDEPRANRDDPGAAAENGPQESADSDLGALFGQMLQRLATAERFSVEVMETTTIARARGENERRSTRSTILAARPNLIRADISIDDAAYRACGNGTTLSLHDRERQVWSDLPAPDTNRHALALIVEQTDANRVLFDLVSGGVENGLLARLEKLEYLGTRRLGSTNCHHIRLSGVNIDGQIWIEPGNTPVPAKLVIQEKTGDATVTKIIRFRAWDFDPAAGRARFKCSIPGDARRVAFDQIRTPGP